MRCTGDVSYCLASAIDYVEGISSNLDPKYWQSGGCPPSCPFGPVQPQMDPTGCGWNLNHQQCRDVEYAIDALMSNNNQMCAAAGDYADELLYEQRIAVDSNVVAFGWSDPLNRYVASGDFIFLGLFAFRHGELANTIAHEEFHLKHPNDAYFPKLADAPHSAANAFGDMCADPVY